MAVFRKDGTSSGDSTRFNRLRWPIAVTFIKLCDVSSGPGILNFPVVAHETPTLLGRPQPCAASITPAGSTPTSSRLRADGEEKEKGKPLTF